MSSWTFETFEKPYKEKWHISASYRWNKGNAYEVFAGVFDDKGTHLWTIFNRLYATKENARRSFRRQVAKLKAE